MDKISEYENTTIHKMMVKRGYKLDSIEYYFTFNSHQEPSCFSVNLTYILCDLIVCKNLDILELEFYIDLELNCATDHSHNIDNINMNDLCFDTYSINCNNFDDTIFYCKISLEPLTIKKLQYYEKLIDKLIKIHIDIPKENTTLESEI